MKLTDFLLTSFRRAPRITGLPKRVRDAVEDRERANEIMARLIQLLIVVTFSLIYTFSPKTSPLEAFTPVPYVLGSYLVFSFAGLIWSVSRRVPHWAVYGSILLDFSLLYGLMISFHIQYMQPASFILKAPTLLYVFIFIAVRALRFQSRFVIIAGLVAAAGWATMIFYVTRIDPGDNMLTRSYVEYLTSNSILIGAEIDKILSILLVTGVLTLVVNGSNHLLVSAVTEQVAARDLSRFFDDSIASGIRESADELQAGTGVNRETAVLFIDIRGFSRLAATMAASSIMQILSVYQSRIVPIVQNNGGVIDKFLGDGVMATFTVDGDRRASSRRAIEAAERILDDLRKWPEADPGLAVIASAGIGMGIASGQVAFGAVGEKNRLEITVIGSAVNMSAKLEKHNKMLGSRLIADAGTYRDALECGYSGGLEPSYHTASIDGLDTPREIVVLNKMGDRKVLPEPNRISTGEQPANIEPGFKPSLPSN